MENTINELEKEIHEKHKKLDRVFMNIAKEVASLSYCERSKVGALIVKDGNIISMGYNGTPKGFDNCCEECVQDVFITRDEVLHAEMNAILKAAKTGNAVEHSTLYITLAPCINCSKYILQSGIKRVVYLNDYRDSSGIQLLSRFIKVEKHFNDGIQVQNFNSSL